MSLVRPVKRRRTDGSVGAKHGKRQMSYMVSFKRIVVITPDLLTMSKSAGFGTGPSNTGTGYVAPQVIGNVPGDFSFPAVCNASSKAQIIILTCLAI
jgi:hypothetical protein